MRGWLKEQGFWVETAAAGARRRAPPPAGSEPQTLTHVFLNGGRARVPPEAHDAFLAAYIDALMRGEVLHLVERAHGTYRMFADLDVRAPSEMVRADDVLKTAITHALRCLPPLLRVAAGDDILVLVRRGAAKAGAHLVWPELYVDDRCALALRDAWARDCEREGAAAASTSTATAIDWDTVIDASVYRRNGLRMPWSLKRGGTVDEVYEPRFTCHHSGTPPHAATDGGEQGAAAEPPPPHHLPHIVYVSRSDVAADPLVWLERASLRAGLGHAVSPLAAALADAADAGGASSGSRRPAVPKKRMATSATSATSTSATSTTLTASAGGARKRRSTIKGTGTRAGASPPAQSVCPASAPAPEDPLQLWEACALRAALPACYATVSFGDPRWSP
jgi:hypothetical protein